METSFRAARVALLGATLSLVITYSNSQTSTNQADSATASQPALAAGNNATRPGVLPASAPAPLATASSPGAGCAQCPAATTAQLASRVDNLAKAIEAAASAAKPPLVDPWQDSKALLLNVFATRVDSWIFGSGSTGVGAAAVLVAGLAFVISVFRLLWAFAMLNPETPDTTWGKFKVQLRKVRFVRWFNFGMACLAVAFTATALYVVQAARGSQPVAETAVNALQSGLKTCQADLATALARDARQLVAQQLLPPPNLQKIETAIAEVGKSCDVTTRSVLDGATQMQTSINAVLDRQPWAITKLYVFLALTTAVLGIGYLVLRTK